MKTKTKLISEAKPFEWTKIEDFSPQCNVNIIIRFKCYRTMATLNRHITLLGNDKSKKPDFHYYTGRLLNENQTGFKHPVFQETSSASLKEDFLPGEYKQYSWILTPDTEWTYIYE
jgi:hypothetical protein